MKKEGWQILAIVFIILFVVETILFVTLYNLGAKEEQKELEIIAKDSKCENYCTDIGSYYYEYSEVEDVCRCYDEEYNLIDKGGVGGARVYEEIA